MKGRGALLVVVVLAILILGMIGAAFLLFGPRFGFGGFGATRMGPDFRVAYSRNAGSIAATITVTNPEPKDLSELRILRADIPTLNGGTPMPLLLGKLPRGASQQIVLLYTGAAPAAYAPLELKLEYVFKGSAYGSGSGVVHLTAILP
jgi:hypothetical protein